MSRNTLQNLRLDLFTAQKVRFKNKLKFGLKSINKTKLNRAHPDKNNHMIAHLRNHSINHLRNHMRNHMIYYKPNYIYNFMSLFVQAFHL